MQANVLGLFIPLRKNVETQSRKYRVNTQNLVAVEDVETVKGRYALEAIKTTEVIDDDGTSKTPDGTEATELTDEEGIYL